MARQKGHVKYQGTIGDIRHFKIKGMDGYFAGLKGGPTANQIKTAPEFARTRENMSEFGGSAKAAKALRLGLGSNVSKFTDSTFTGRLTAFMKQINLKDTTGVRGKRAIKISQNRDVLKNIVFRKGVSFDSICKVAVKINTDGGGLAIEDIRPAASMLPPVAPMSATHYRLVYNIQCISDYAYNEDTKTYEPLVPEAEGQSLTEYAAYQPVTSPVDAWFQPNIDGYDFPNSPNCTTIVAIGIEFYVKNNDDYLPIAGGAMKIATAHEAY